MSFDSSKLILGLDEVGRGCVAGPVCVAAVAFPSSFYTDEPDWMSDVVDSKLLTEKKRETLASLIHESALCAKLKFIPAEEVDRINVLQASLQGFRFLVEEIAQENEISAVLVDGPYTVPQIGTPQKAVIKGDRVSRSIAAASIIAKVHRDQYMIKLSKDFPEYAWESNKGYGTQKHWEALETYGLTSEHRRSFLKKLGALSRGRDAEDRAAQMLKNRGFQIIERNWKSVEAEIDIIALKGREIHFVEVRYRKDGSLEKSFPETKRQQLKKASRIYLSHSKPSFDEIHFDFIFADDELLEVFWNESI